MSKPSDISLRCLDLGLDPERGIDALGSLIRDEKMHFAMDKAVAIILERIEAHGYPEPYVEPEPEMCINCRSPKHPCACGCFPLEPSIPPDVPGWMGVAVTAGDAREAMDKFAESMERVRRAANMSREDMQRKRAEVLSLGPPLSKPLLGKISPQPSWDNPPPCICGGAVPVQVSADRDKARLHCWTCGRVVVWKYYTITPDARDAVLAAWTDGKGGIGEVYYVESESKKCWACAGHSSDHTEHICGVESEPAEPVSVTINSGTGKMYRNGEEVQPPAIPSDKGTEQ
jgi:hypothetical protein